MVETAPILAWTLQSEIPVPADVHALLVEGERAVASFKTFRDSATFTTKRLIERAADARNLDLSLTPEHHRMKPGGGHGERQAQQSGPAAADWSFGRVGTTP